MGYWRKRLTAGVVWLTAALTAVVGTPHVLCHCANGSIRVPGLFSIKQACCAHKPAHPAPRKPACPHCRPHTAKPVGPQLAGSSCHQTLAQRVVFSCPDSRPALIHISLVDTLPAAGNAAGSPLMSRNHGVHAPDQQPPPTERVITLQRFLI